MTVTIELDEDQAYEVKVALEERTYALEAWIAKAPGNISKEELINKVRTVESVQKQLPKVKL